MRKKFTKLVTVLGLTTIMSINTLAASFTDVSNTHWAYNQITYMQEEGYLLKNSAGQFLPNEKMTYFDYAELLAKISGYLDEKFVPDMDPVLKANIAKMYEQQIPYINQYDNDDKYKTWSTSSNEEIAYLLAIGYMNTDDLARFMIKSATGQEARRVLNKQDLARYLVYYIGKAKTATDTYTGSTGFADDALIRDENKPYVAYLKANGLISGDENNNYGANTEVTRALASFMTVSAIEFKEELASQSKEEPETEVEQETEVEEETGSDTITLHGKVKNIIPRNDGTNDKLLLLEQDAKSSFLDLGEEAIIKDGNGDETEQEYIEVGQEVIVLAVEGDVVKQLIILDFYNEDIEVDDDEDEAQEDEEQDEEDQDETTKEGTYTGEVRWVGRNGDLTIATEEGTLLFELAKDHFISDGIDYIDFEELQAGDEVKITVEDDEITEIIILSQKEEDVVAGDMVFVNSIHRMDHYILRLQQGDELIEMEVPKEIDITRDGDEADLSEIRIGDVLNFETEDDKVIAIEAESSEAVIEGIVKSVLIAQMSEVVVETEEGDVTVAITTDTEIYDDNTREDMTIREIYLGSHVEVRMESSEALSFIVEKAPSKINYKGTIENIWSGSRYIDVLVEYDAETGEDMIIKTFAVPTETSIEIDGDETHRNELEEGMEVLVSVSYGELYPEKIIILEN